MLEVPDEARSSPLVDDFPSVTGKLVFVAELSLSVVPPARRRLFQPGDTTQ